MDAYNSLSVFVEIDAKCFARPQVITPIIEILNAFSLINFVRRYQLSKTRVFSYRVSENVGWKPFDVNYLSTARPSDRS